MSQAPSSSTGKPYGLARVCRVWQLARSTVYWHRHTPAEPGTRRGPVGPYMDGGLWGCIRRFLGAVLYQGVRTSPRRVFPLMRAHGFLAPTRHGHPHGPKAHDGTIIPTQVDTMW